MLDILGFFIPKCQFDIRFSNENPERTFYPSLYNLELMRRLPEIYYMLGSVVNEVILNPELALLNFKALRLMKRYYYWNPGARTHLIGPILALLNNIGGFSSVK
jgi:hypothetical protein